MVRSTNDRNLIFQFDFQEAAASLLSQRFSMTATGDGKKRANSWPGGASLVTIPDVFAKAYSAQSPTRFLSGK